MPTHYPTFAKHKHIIIPVLIGIAAVIGYQSWKDLQPRKQQQGTEYFEVVRDNAALKEREGDEKAAIFAVWAGDIVADRDDVTLAPSPVRPVNLPQREIILLYRLQGLPEDNDAVAKAIGPSARDWKRVGNFVNTIYLDFGKDAPDLASLGEAAERWKAALNRDYLFGVTLPRAALEKLERPKDALAGLDKGVHVLIFDANEAVKEGETLFQAIEAIGGYEYPFLMRVAEIPREPPPAVRRFAGFLLDAPAKPVSDKE